MSGAVVELHSDCRQYCTNELTAPEDNMHFAHLSQGPQTA